MSTKDINTVINNRGNNKEHLMLILRDIENASGKNVIKLDALKQVSNVLNMPQSSVAGFVDFYTMFSTKTRAKFIIRVCKSGPCHVMGSTTVIDVIKQHLGIDFGEATKDGLFYLEKCECLGVCSVAPAIMINYDLHGKLTKKKLIKLLDSYKKKKPTPSEDSGDEVAGINCINTEPKQEKRLLELIGKVDPLSIGSYLKFGGYEALNKALTMKREDIIEIVKESGLRGRGGAGFPAGMKWSFVKKGDIQKYVICNADEGEPGTYKDRILMEENPHMLIEGMAICGYAIDATVGYIYVRGEYRRSIERLQNAIDQARRQGYLGKNICGTNISFDIFIKEGGGAYVCGEETSLINSMEGKRGYPRFKPPFPGEAGFKNLPSNVNNVETLYSVPLIVSKGADWYKSVGTTNCYGTKLYCLSGHLNKTGLIEMPMGTTLRTIIDKFGKGIKDGKKFKFAQVGGSAGGILGKDLLDLPLDIDQTAKNGVTLGSGVVLVCDEDTCSVDFLLQVLSFFEHESCGQCVPCRVGTKHLHYIIKKIASRHANVQDIGMLLQISNTMKKASLCALGQSPILPITTMLKYFRKEFEAHCNPDYKCKQCDNSLSHYYKNIQH